jgi:hypothetical protein
MPKVVEAPQGKMPDVPKGFSVQVFAKGTRRGGFLAHRSDVGSADEREILPARNGRTACAGYPPSYPQEMVFRRENPDRPVRFARLPSFAGERESQTGFTTEKGSRNRPSKNAACYTRRGMLKLKPE